MRFSELSLLPLFLLSSCRSETNRSQKGDADRANSFQRSWAVASVSETKTCLATLSIEKMEDSAQPVSKSFTVPASFDLANSATMARIVKGPNEQITSPYRGKLRIEAIIPGGSPVKIQEVSVEIWLGSRPLETRAIKLDENECLDEKYEVIRRELVARIPVHTPEWTNHNAEDPGVSICEKNLLLEAIELEISQAKDRLAPVSVVVDTVSKCDPGGRTSNAVGVFPRLPGNAGDLVRAEPTPRSTPSPTPTVTPTVTQTPAPTPEETSTTGQFQQ